MKIAIVGSGIAGNVVAHHLHKQHDITVFEAGDHIGGHTHTHRIEMGGEVHQVDTGFIVFNDRTYPNFVALLQELGVASQASSMSFSVRNEGSGLEYNGTSLNTLFAQRRNVLRPSFLGMLADILRFHREAPRLLEDGEDAREIALGDFLAEGRYRRPFIDDYLVPMAASIWSTDPVLMMGFPARFLVRFMHNHGMLTVDDRPVWRVVTGGSARYVERLVAPWRDRIHLNCPVERIRRQPDGVLVQAQGRPPQHFDHVFMACHAGQALRTLADASREEREILGALPTQRNEAVLHTDTSLLPRTRRAWAAWNYHVPARPTAGRVALTYQMNILQGLATHQPLQVSLNALERIDPRCVLKTMVYEHPVFTPAGIAAQRRHHEISGVRRTHYCGAYWRYGFHEDGVVSALMALRRFEEGQHAKRDLQRVA
ncbi:NAD(P)/FAD-dependent oxidoreductase [Ideonella sp. YS5]|uniref:NAD(P)/FAD-dependent oxidoreductase n=1 Tax=Ideonella sp. YS5 TaxID=3453714 RepID=UPI003EEE7C1E